MNNIINIIQLNQVMQNTEGQEQLKFKLLLNEHLKSRGLENRDLKTLNQFALYKLVCRRGGCQSVTNHNQWKNIAEELQCKDELKVKNHYYQYLFGYERKNYFGCEEQDEEAAILINAPRKLVKGQNKARIEENASLESQILKSLQELGKPQPQMYFHKSRLNQSKIETKRILLGFETFAPKKSQIYSLNMLLLYSTNPEFPFFLQNNEKLFQAMSSFSSSIYPPKDQYQKQCLRTIVAIFRNLTMYNINLKHILGTPIFDLFVKIFNTRLDNECSRNIIDIMTGLVKVGYSCDTIISQIQDCLFEDRIQELETGIQLIRNLVEQRDDSILTQIKNRIDVFTQILSSYDISNEMKEQVMEILASVSDISTDARISFSRNTKLMGILIGILQHMRNQEKLSQFAALTLSNISTSPGARQNLSFFETELIQIGFTDDSLAGIVANILADIANV